MALRAGYYGLKRRFKDKLESIALAWDETISSLFPRSEQLILGAVNLASIASDSVTYHKTDSRTHTYYFNRINKGKYYISFDVSDAANLTKQMTMQIGHSGLYITPHLQFNATNGHHEYAFEIDDTESYIDRIYALINSEDDANATCKISNIMIALAPGLAYAPYAMTNQELTASATDQKTTINAIISAATGAADFAAFKTAMEAITPVTRSLSMAAAPEEIVKEEITEEPIVEKKTTRKKSTAKADTKEEV